VALVQVASWTVGRAMKVRIAGVEEVASREWRVTSLRKKQIPRYARNDNSRAVGAVRVRWKKRKWPKGLAGISHNK
jgi:hypothetical protein